MKAEESPSFLLTDRMDLDKGGKTSKPQFSVKHRELTLTAGLEHLANRG